MKKKTTAYNIALFIFIAALIVACFGLKYYEEHQESQKESEASSSQGQTSPSKETPPQSPAPSNPAPAPKPQPTASEADYDRLESILPQNDVIQALPDDARILLSFFNFNTGYREWERDYLLGKGSAVQVDYIPEDLDMKMIMHSRNVPLLKEGNLCEVIAIAKENKDYATETIRSKASLLWKYKGVMGYKDCLGL